MLRNRRIFVTMHKQRSLSENMMKLFMCPILLTGSTPKAVGRVALVVSNNCARLAKMSLE